MASLIAGIHRRTAYSAAGRATDSPARRRSSPAVYAQCSAAHAEVIDRFTYSHGQHIGDGASVQLIPEHFLLESSAAAYIAR